MLHLSTDVKSDSTCTKGDVTLDNNHRLLHNTCLCLSMCWTCSHPEPLWPLIRSAKRRKDTWFVFTSPSWSLRCHYPLSHVTELMMSADSPGLRCLVEKERSLQQGLWINTWCMKPSTPSNGSEGSFDSETSTSLQVEFCGWKIYLFIFISHGWSSFSSAMDVAYSLLYYSLFLVLMWKNFGFHHGVFFFFK